MLWGGGEFKLAFPRGPRNTGDWSYTIRYVPGKSLREMTETMGASVCSEALRLCDGNKKEAARMLDISRDTLYRYIRMIRQESKTSTEPE